MTGVPSDNSAMQKLLVVDDDEDMLKLLTVMARKGWLRKYPWRRQGQDALTKISLVRPNLVVTDLFMDGMDGMDLLAEVHRDNPLMPIIMLSGQAQIPDAVKATHMGTAAFLSPNRLIKEVLLGGDYELHANFRRRDTSRLVQRRPRIP